MKDNQAKSNGHGGRRPGAGRKKGSRNKTTAELMAAAQEYSTEALETFLAIMRGGDSDTARLAAADKMLDRGHGKAPQPQTGEGGKGPIELRVGWLQPQS